MTEKTVTEIGIVDEEIKEFFKDKPIQTAFTNRSGAKMTVQTFYGVALPHTIVLEDLDALIVRSVPTSEKLGARVASDMWLKRKGKRRVRVYPEKVEKK